MNIIKFLRTPILKNTWVEVSALAFSLNVGDLLTGDEQFSYYQIQCYLKSLIKT